MTWVVPDLSNSPPHPERSATRSRTAAAVVPLRSSTAPSRWAIRCSRPQAQQHAGHSGDLVLLDEPPPEESGRRTRGQRLATIPGIVPSLFELPPGCRFHDRCEIAEERCVREEPLLELRDDRAVRCHYPLEAD